MVDQNSVPGTKESNGEKKKARLRGGVPLSWDAVNIDGMKEHFSKRKKEKPPRIGASAPTKTEILTALRPEIIELHEAGWTYEQIAHEFKEQFQIVVTSAFIASACRKKKRKSRGEGEAIAKPATTTAVVATAETNPLALPPKSEDSRALASRSSARADDAPDVIPPPPPKSKTPFAS